MKYFLCSPVHLPLEWHLAYLVLVVLVDVEVGELAQMPRDVPETNDADFGFVSLLTNAAENENKSVIFNNKCQQNLTTCFHH